MKLLVLIVLQFAFLSAAGQFRVERYNNRVVMLDKDVEILSYVTNSSRTKYNRVGYIHPLNDLNGKNLTEDAPEDHPYHNGIFWAWHQILYDGRWIANSWICDNVAWSIKKYRARVGNDKITLSSTVDWKVAVNTGEKPKSFLRELLAITVYPMQFGYRVVDVDIHLKRKVSKEVMIGGSDDLKGYGGFCVRLGYYDNIIFNSSKGGVEPRETAVFAGNWVDFAKKDSENEGVVVFAGGYDHGFKGEWILRDYASMQNPVFPGRSPVAVTKKGINLKFRIIVYGRDFEKHLLPMLYDDYKKVIKK